MRERKMIKDDQTKNIDALSVKVTFVGGYSRGKAPRPSRSASGTGFFFKHNDRSYLITNRHMVIDERSEYFPDFLGIEVHTDKNRLSETRFIEIPLYERKQELWTEHADNQKLSKPEDKIDVVAIRIDKHLRSDDWIEFFTPYDLPESNMFPIGLGDSCIIMGYPLGIHDRSNYLPVARIGAIASTWGICFDRKKYFLVDSKLHPGVSGSPVIIPQREVGGGYYGTGFCPLRLIGVISGTPWSGLDLNIAWYSDLILEIILESEKTKKD
jgi:hypothetical protein